MSVSIDVLDRHLTLAETSSVNLEFRLAEHVELIEAVVWLRDGNGYHVADVGWKQIQKDTHVTFRVQFTRTGVVRLVGCYEVRYVQDRRYRSKRSAVSLLVQVLPPFPAPTPYDCNADNYLIGSRETVETSLDQKVRSGNAISWIWLSGLPGIGKTMLLKRMQQEWITQGDLVHWLDLANCKSYDLPAYVAQEISKPGHDHGSVTGEEQLLDALSIALEEAREHADKRGDGKQMVVVILDGIHEITSPEYLSRFVDTIRVVKEFDGKGELSRDTRIHWRIILSHRLPLSVYQSSLPGKDISMFDGMDTVPVTPWTSNEIRSYIQSHGDGQSRFVYQCQGEHRASHRLVPKLWRVTGGYPALINAYLYSFGDLYRLDLQYKRPLYIIKEIYEQIEDPCRITPMVRCTAENLARSFVSLLCQEQQEVLRHDIAGRYCSLDNCLSAIESKCSREYYPALGTLRELGIWRTDTRACPFGSPLIATSLFFDH